MPHLILDHSANLAALTDIGALCEALRAAAVTTGVLPLAGVRVRAVASEHYAIADGHPDNAYLHIMLRLREGRSDADKRHASEVLFAAAQQALAPVIATAPFALSLEVCDITAAFAPKLNTIRDHMKERE